VKYSIRYEGEDAYDMIVDQDGRLCFWDESQGWSEYNYPDKHLYKIVWHPEQEDVIEE